MATGHRLPNGYVCILLTPREATLHRDQILDPGEYPWLNPTESQMVAMEIRGILERAVVEDSLQRLGEASNEMARVMMRAAQEQKLKKQGKWQCPDEGCQYVNGREDEACQQCGKDRPQEEEPQAEEVPELP